MENDTKFYNEFASSYRNILNSFMHVGLLLKLGDRVLSEEIDLDEVADNVIVDLTQVGFLIAFPEDKVKEGDTFITEIGYGILQTIQKHLVKIDYYEKDVYKCTTSFIFEKSEEDIGNSIIRVRADSVDENLNLGHFTGMREMLNDLHKHLTKIEEEQKKHKCKMINFK